MVKVLILRGLPASGKSTYARNLLTVGNKKGTKWKHVNKDDLRAMLDDSKHTKGNENFVLETRDFIILRCVALGVNVVVDDTNLNPKHEQHIRDLVGNTAEVDTMDFEIDLEEAIARDLKRPVSVGERVIRHMYNEYVLPKQPKPEPYVAPADVPYAIICDIDGTLAHMTKEGRLRFGKQAPYAWKHVGEDAVDERVKSILQNYYASRKMPNDFLASPQVILFSGRDSICRTETEAWLYDNNIPYDALYMRPEGDSRKDSIIKAELFDAHIRGKYDVLFVLDDRNQVVDMWRGLGLKCLQVEPGDF